MKFVPLCVRQSIDCIAFTTDVFSEDIRKATMEWIGAALKVTKCVQEVNFEKKLMRKGVVRKIDWRKIVKLFKGWGSCSYDKEVVKRIAKEVSKERVKAAVEKEKLERACEKACGEKLKENVFPEVYKKLRDLRFQTVRSVESQY